MKVCVKIGNKKPLRTKNTTEFLSRPTQKNFRSA